MMKIEIVGASGFVRSRTAEILYEKGVGEICPITRASSNLDRLFVNMRAVFHRDNLPKAERFALFYIYTSREPTRPDICKANFKFNHDQLISSSETLPRRQRDCINWGK